MPKLTVSDIFVPGDAFQGYTELIGGIAEFSVWTYSSETIITFYFDL